MSQRNSVWWTSEEYKNDNKPCSEEAWADLKAKAVKELSGKKLYVVDTFCGANEGTRLKVRFIMEVAWQAHFVKNMFIRQRWMPWRQKEGNSKALFFLTYVNRKGAQSIGV